MREHQTHSDHALRPRLQLAQEALELSDRNMQLTISIFLTQGAMDIAPLLAERVENSAKISELIHKISEQCGSSEERKLLDAAAAQWSWTHNYHRLPNPLPVVPGRKSVKAETAMLNVMLPLLLDNHSWKVAVEFLRAQMDLSGADEEPRQEMANWLEELVNTNQRLKTKVVELERIEESLSQLASIVEFSSDAIVIHALDGTIVSFNKGAEDIYGYSAGEVIGLSRSILFEDGKEDEWPDISERLKSGDGIQLSEKVHVRKDGRRLDVSMTVSPVKDASGMIVGAVAITRDVTDRKVLEAQLRQAQKMECVGRLSGGVAHDFNNILGVIIGYSGLLEESPDIDGSARKSVQEIMKAGQRAAALTRQLLAFSRQQVLDSKVLNLNNVVADISKMLYRLIGEHIELQTILDPDLKQVRADKGQIEQILVNLAINARDAMPRGGKLFIQTSNVELRKTLIAQYVPANPGKYVLLSVADNGIGMDKETQSHIFEPFFTTKAEDKGTGLGLSVVYGVVKQSGGYITVHSNPGEGSTFKIYLPLIEETVDEENRPCARSEPAKGSETILLVEDEESLRALTRGLLVQCGYTVWEASNGPQALEIGHQHANGIDLLLTDVVLPGMSGIVLAEKLAKICPDIKTVFVSGYTHYAAGGQRTLELGGFLLHKPFSPGELRSKVREVLDTNLCRKA